MKTKAASSRKKGQINRKRDLERTRKRILTAAAKEFDRLGFTGAKLHNIAKRARVNRAMIYYIFQTKEQLYLAVLESLFEAQSIQIEKVLSKETVTLEDMRSLLDTYYDLVMEKKEAVRILAHDIITGAKMLRRFNKRKPALHTNFHRVSSAIRELTEKGWIRKVDPELSLMAVVLVTSFLTCMLPHMDVAAPKGTTAHKVLSDPKTWKPFLFEGAMRVITSESEQEG